MVISDAKMSKEVCGSISTIVSVWCFSSQYGQKYSKNTKRKNRVVQEPDVRNLPKVYEPVYPSVITQVIMPVFHLNMINIWTKKIDLNFANFY